MAKLGDLRVWHVPQVPGKGFVVRVSSPHEAGMIIDTLERYDLFQYENNIKPDYTNMSGVSIYSDEDDEGYPEWVEWFSEEGESFEEWWAINKPGWMGR